MHWGTVRVTTNLGKTYIKKKKAVGRPKKDKKPANLVKAGRPQEFYYTEDKQLQLFEIMARAGSLAEILKAFDIRSPRTWYLHLEKNEAMKADYELGKELSKQYFTTQAKIVIENPDDPKFKNFNTKLFTWLASVKHPEEFGVNANKSTQGNTINIGNVNQVVNRVDRALEYNQILEQLEQFAQDQNVIKELTDVEVIDGDSRITE